MKTFLVYVGDDNYSSVLPAQRDRWKSDNATLNCNRLCPYRGTPLWREYVARGIIDDERDWHKWFKCSDIDPPRRPARW